MSQRAHLHKKLLLLLLGIALLACQPLQFAIPQIETRIATAVAATLTAWPTQTPAPTLRPIPTLTPTPYSLQGLFCEYRFCIGHPPSIAFYDLLAAQDQRQPSGITKGMLVTYREDLLILLNWQEGETPQRLLDTMLDVRFDTAIAQATQRTLAGQEVWFLPIHTTATLLLPRGAIAAWQCGTRAFGWKAYTPRAEDAEELLQEAMRRFRCE